MITGLFRKANRAENEAQIVNERDKIEAEVINSYDKRGILKLDILASNLEYIKDAQIDADNFPVIVKFNEGNRYTIDREGNVSACTAEPIGIGKKAEANGTIYGTEPNYKNPIIPKGFKAVDTDDAKWATADGYTKGLVIEDATDGSVTKGSQFVWVPVDGTDLKYEKHVYETAKVDDTDWANTLDSGNGNWRTYYYRNWEDWTDNGGDSSSVTKYGGFYIGRYEAGIPQNASFYGNENGATYTKTTSNNTGKDVTTYTPVSKKNFPVWNYISQVNAKTVSEKMYNNEAVKSSLIDSYAWDTVTTWMQNSGVNVTDSTSWGNYINSVFDINGLYALHSYDSTNGWSVAENYSKGAHSILNGDRTETATGITDRNKAKNIYDFAGNMYEWTTETGHRDGTTTTTFAVLRGGSFSSGGSSYPACFRYGDYGESSCYVYFGFRVVLYIQ